MSLNPSSLVPSKYVLYLSNYDNSKEFVEWINSSSACCQLKHISIKPKNT